jgi:hypothetical protein
MNKILALLTITIFLTVYSCTKEEIDDVKPTIDSGFDGAYPGPCDTLRKGKEAIFTIKFTDNIELGSYSIDIHNNFDQHSHSTSVESCQLNSKKKAIKPWTYIKSYQIPEGLKEFTATGNILVPADIDPGDYHFLYKLTDKSGWQTINGFSIKVVE